MDYNDIRQSALQRKQELVERQKQIEVEQQRLDKETEQNKRELIAIEQILDGLELATSTVPPDFESPSLTDHIRKILQQTTVPLLPTQIRDSCLAVGIKGSSMKNLLISVHAVLERLKAHLDTKEVEGKTAYIWKRPAGTNPSAFWASLLFENALNNELSKTELGQKLPMRGALAKAAAAAGAASKENKDK